MSSLERFLALFSGYEHAYGTYDARKPADGGKVNGRALTVRGPLTTDLIHGHLSGDGLGIGVVPLREDNTVRFGVIDVDIQGAVKLREDIADLERRVRAFKMPLVICRSKSGGAHLYLFCSEPTPAELVVALLGRWAALLGYGGCEIFPKQTSRANADDVGNWINLPYFRATATTRYGMIQGRGVHLGEFIDHAEKHLMSIEKLENLEVVDPAHGELFADGPPCLQVLAPMGFPAGTRNDGLFNIALYYRKKNPDGWQDDVVRFNVENMDPPLTNSEVQTVLKSADKKDYVYGCQKPPISSHCNKRECRKREFGIGGGAGAGGNGIQIDSLTKLESRDEKTGEILSARWIIEIDGRRIEITTQDLFNQKTLQQRIAERLTKVMSEMPKPRFERRLRELMETASIQIEPQDASREGQFRLIVEAFATGHGRAKHRDELLRGNPWSDPSTGNTHFRSEDFFAFLKQKHFSYENQLEVWGMLRNLGAGKKTFNIKGKCCSTWFIPTPETFNETEPLEVPDFQGEQF